MVSKAVSVAANRLLSVLQQKSASLVPTHVKSANEATALIVSSGMFAVRAARK